MARPVRQLPGSSKVVEAWRRIWHALVSSCCIWKLQMLVKSAQLYCPVVPRSSSPTSLFSAASENARVSHAQNSSGSYQGCFPRPPLTSCRLMLSHWPKLASSMSPSAAWTAKRTQDNIPTAWSRSKNKHRCAWGWCSNPTEAKGQAT